MTNAEQHLKMENLTNHKRKFNADDQIITSRILTIHQQVESTVPTKKIKSTDIERIMMEVDEVVITDKSSTTKTPAIRVPNHCNGICDADASPTSYVIRCYCDPYRLNAIIPYNSDIY